MGRLATVLALLFVAIAVVLRLRPQLCFSIPEIGYIVFFIVTQSTGPPYIATDCYSDIDDWTRDGDVIVSTIVKGGTSWVLYIAHLIRIRGDESSHPWHEVNTNTPWPSLRHRPGQSWQQLRQLMNSTVLVEGLNVRDLWDHEDYMFRVFKAHEAPVDSQYGTGIGARDLAVLPLHTMRHDVRFIAMYRDLPDIMASLLPFINAHTDEFRTLWGGMPPRIKSVEELMSLMFIPYIGLARQCMVYLRIWWKNRKHPRVLLLHYNDAVNDLEGVTRRIVQFTGASGALSEEALQAVVAKATFASMKKMNDLFSYRLWANPDAFNGTMTAITKGRQLRRGAIGDGKLLLSPEQLARVRLFLQEQLGDDEQLLHWSEHGGAFHSPP